MPIWRLSSGRYYHKLKTTPATTCTVSKGTEMAWFGSGLAAHHSGLRPGWVTGRNRRGSRPPGPSLRDNGTYGSHAGCDGATTVALRLGMARAPTSSSGLWSGRRTGPRVPARVPGHVTNVPDARSLGSRAWEAELPLAIVSWPDGKQVQLQGEAPPDTGGGASDPATSLEGTSAILERRVGS